MQLNLQNTVPLVAVGMDYSFTERGALPEGLEASGLAAAFGPEPRADEAPQPDGVSARIQVGDALVALLEHHHKHRWGAHLTDFYFIHLLGTPGLCSFNMALLSCDLAQSWGCADMCVACKCRLKEECIPKGCSSLLKC